MHVLGSRQQDTNTAVIGNVDKLFGLQAVVHGHERCLGLGNRVDGFNLLNRRLHEYSNSISSSNSNSRQTICKRLDARL